MVSTTTISTIAVQSGSTRIIIAILRAGLHITIKILDMQPGIAYIGNSFGDAAELQMAHNEVIKSLQSKQSPVEDLLRQADGMIANQKPRAEVYSAMADSLGQAWRDLNGQLEQRKTILDQNYMFQGHFQDYREVTNDLEHLCINQKIPEDHGSVEVAIKALTKGKRTMLESSVYALQEGDTLLDMLQKMKDDIIMDSRPKFMRNSFLLTIGQVELWLEELHDRRVAVTNLFECRFEALRQQLDLLRVGSDLAQLDELIREKTRALSLLKDLGCSTSTCDELIRQTMSMQNEAQHILNRCLEVVSNGKHGRMEASAQAYKLVEQAEAYQQQLDHRLGLLSRASGFFQNSQSAHYHMDQLELQIRNVDPLKHSRSALDTLESIYDTLDESIETVVKDGNDIIYQAHSSEATTGISHLLEQLKSRASNLKTMCNLKSSQVIRGGEALKSFVAKLEEFDAWIKDVVQTFLETNSNMGTSWDTSNFFLENHKDLVNKIHMKTFELEGLRGALKTIANQCSNEETKAVEERMDRCNETLTTLMQVISQRLTIAEKFVKFQKSFEQVDNEMSNMEQELRENNQADRMLFESSWIFIQQLHTQISNMGRNIIQDLDHVNEPRLDKNATISFVQDATQLLSERNALLGTHLNSLDIQAKEGQLVEEEWTMIHNEKRQSMEFSNRIDHELFPLISGDLNRPETILANLEARILQLPKQKMMSERLVQLISRVEDLWTRLPESKKPEAKELISDLRQKLKALQLLFSEYELILQMMIPFFKNYGELYHTKRNLLNQYQEGKIPNDVVTREHEAGRTSLLEILRFAKRERDSIVKKIGDQKSKHLLKADKDTLEELLDTFETDFQTAWNERKKVLTKHAKFCLFTTSLRQLSQDIHSLQETAKIRTTLGETLSSVNAANAYLQEIQPLLQDFKRRINLCEQESKSIMEQMPVHRATVKLGLDQVHERWNILHDWLDTHGQRLSSAVEYFGLLEQSENFSRDANKTLLEWSQRISSLNSKEDAHQLKLEIEKFIKIRKSSQNEIILKISGMAGHVFGDATVQKTQIIQREQEDTFDALTKLFQQVDLYITHEKSINEGIARSQRIQAEAEANIRAAKAEAEAARRAVKEAEEARKRAEEKSIKTKLTQVICHETQTDVDKEASKSSEERSLAPKFVQYLQDQALLEGGRCVLKAKITGTPEPQITWFKDGVAILGNSDYFTQNRNGECSLTIEETFVADSANWSVRASNCAGYAESHAKLTVKELKPIETPSPPKVTLPLRNHQLVEGESLELRCQFSGFPSPQISWFRDGICVDRSKNFTIGEDQGADILRIEQISLSDKGVFSAKAVNNVGQCKTEAKVEIKSVAPALMPEFEVPLENQEVVTGEAVLLECSVTGTPNPEITWFHNNRALKASGDIRFTYDGSKARLMIKHAFPKTLGHYLCKAKNSVGEATSTATIANKPIVPDTSDSEAVDAEPVRAKFKPAFRVPLNNVEVLEDKNVMLECVIVGNPAPDVMWYKDNFPLKENSNLTITSRGDHFQICMKNVSQDQGGDYKVRAINTLGECQSTCRFKILPKKKTSVSSTQTIEEVKQSKVVHTYSHSIAKDNRAPRFIKPIQSQVIDEGGSVKFDGILDGTPWPKVTWTHNGVALNTNPNLKFFQQGQKVSLMISKVEMSGTGQYACHAENEGGSSQCTAELQVQQIIVPPSFVKKLRSCHFKAGDRIIMDIEASGLPLPIVSWYKDGVLLSPSNKIQFRQHGNHFSLIVTKSTVDDSGKYSVELTSSSGQAISQCLVDVKAKPVPIQGPKEKDMVLQSRALNVLSTWKGSNKELPELLPFPFKPEESGPRKRNRGKVPKPSKFIPGEMYHSDYDTDWEGALPAKWKPCYSDAEDLYYKRVRPQLDWNRNSRRPERNPSPPCPHKWESHEEIDKLVASLKDQRTDLRKEMQSIKTSHLTENIEEMTKITIISTRSSSTQQSHNRYLKPLPSSQPLLEDGEKPKIDGIFATVFRDGHEHSEPNDETDPLEDDVKYYKSHAEVVQRPVIPIVTTSAFTPPSSITTTKPNSPCDDISFSSQSTVKQAKKTKFVGVKEKVKILEQKVEDYLSYDSEQSESRGATPVLRPEEIPGAVRVFPVPSPCHSRKSSTTRSSSADTNNWYRRFSSSPSPLTTPGMQRKWSGGTPPPMYMPSGPRHHSLTNLEPFPFKPDAPLTKPRSKIPPPPSPSKFIKGKFRDSDYHSDLEGTIPPKWTPSGAVKQPLESLGPNPQINLNTTDVENDAQFDGPNPEYFPLNPNSAPNNPSQPSSMTSSTDSQQWSTSINQQYQLFNSQSQFQRGKDGYGCSSEFSPGSTLERGGGEDRRGGVSTSACSSIDRAYWSKSKTTTETSAQSVEETTPTNTLGRYDNCRTPTNDPSFPIDSDCQNLPKKSSPKIKKRHDGYEADTDDTLKRRKSVRELASSFQEAENACPSPKPIRPNYPGSETEYDSDFESRTTSLKRSFSKLREPSFMKSRAYVPPKWAPAPGEGQSTEKSCPMTESMASTEIHRTYSCQQETRMIRFDNQLVADDSPMNTSDKIVFGQSFNAGIKSNSQELPPNPKSKRVKTIPQFFPKKFIPRISSATEPTSWTFEDQGSTQSKIKAKWAPSDSETEEPSYRKIRPNLKNQSMIESGNHQSNDSKNNSGIVHNIKVEQKNESDHRTQSHSNSYRSTDQGLRKVDPETGLLYFKYDFGYEFGLMVPQEEQSNSSALIKSMSEDLRPRVGSEVLIEMILNVGTDCNVEWRWNNQPLPDDKRRQFLSSGSKHTLVIKEVRTEDNGIYTCLVISPLTTETRSCTLTVEGETLL
eukprot:TCALIF_02628-PA protein Name:"Similar to unc-89 Muscle M-line assembly protein unc-89 (Caenorhabditis elegans)" AED:0.08 eAED:0.03 QI:0/0.71/0.12/1/1/0.87/8/85/2824